MNGVWRSGFWVERGLFASACVFGVWALLMSAQAHFYASLPVPEPSRVTRPELPGEGPSSGAARSSSHRAGAVSAGSWVAKLEAPSVGLAATVIEGSADQQLARAAGHIEETAWPGDPGNIGIAGHRDTIFRPLRKLKVGDTLRLITGDAVYEYRIERTWIVKPEDVSVLDATHAPSLTLVTCYPFTFIGHAPKRYIVRAVLERRSDR